MGARIKEFLADRVLNILMLLTLFCLGLTSARVIYTGKLHFIFMAWNLFLAFVPLILASIIYYGRIRNKPTCFIFGLFWLAFFPNAPYLLTDFIHLGYTNNVPVWLDMILLSTYGFTGLLCGFHSLRMFESCSKVVFGVKRTWIPVVFILFLSSFGVYLGRFLRWNSWDLLTNTFKVLVDVFAHIIDPLTYRSAWIFTLIFGIFLNLTYFCFRWSGKSVSLDAQTPQTLD